MDDGPALRPTPVSGHSGDRLIASIVGVVLVAFVGLALAKPWAGPAAVPTPLPSDVARGPGRSPSASAPPHAAVEAATRQLPLPVAFIMPAPRPSSATWTGLRWRRLAADDPLNLVTSMLRWRGGYVAVGFDSRLPQTPVWTSADGSRWQPLPFNTATTPWPGSAVLGMADVGRGLVALTETAAFCGEPCSPTYILPIVAWTSSDGRAWQPHMIPPEWFASPVGRAPLVASGPAGLIVASPGPASHVAWSTDGSRWSLLPAGAFPARFVLAALKGTRDGYVALGRTASGAGATNPGEAATLWSADGRHWASAPSRLPTAADAAPGASGAFDLLTGAGGSMAMGAAYYGDSFWWQSSDGRTWHPLDGFPPLGAAPPGAGGGPWLPNGTIAADGQQLVAIRGGPEGGAWSSVDGLGWRRLAMSGDVPKPDVHAIALLPAGVLVGDGPTTWFGEAQVARSP